MKKPKDMSMWLKRTFLVLLVAAYASLVFMNPIYVDKVRVSTERATKIGEEKEGAIYVLSSSIIHESNQDWIWIVQHNMAKKIKVKTGDRLGSYIEIKAGLLLKDAYLQNPDQRLIGKTEKKLDWNFELSK